MKLKGWKELWDEVPAPVIPEPATSREVKTGDWRTLRPVWDPEKCTHCMLCWLYCPDSCIMVELDERGRPRMVGIDMDYCKGCGICAEVCPDRVKAITMEKEVK